MAIAEIRNFMKTHITLKVEKKIASIHGCIIIASVQKKWFFNITKYVSVTLLIGSTHSLLKLSSDHSLNTSLTATQPTKSGSTARRVRPVCRG